MQAMIDRIEAAIHRDVGRGMDPIFQASRGGLWAATAALAATPAPKIGLITGFFVPSGDPPAAETDGPAGAALLACGFAGAGLACRFATDLNCRAACQVALDTAGAGHVPVDSLAPDGRFGQIDSLIDLWRRNGIDWVIAIERCGPAADGVCRNMRGADISAYAASLDRLFSAGPWRTIAIGDGGNEIGMGSVPRELVGQHVPLGEVIGCTIPAEFLIAAGVSHWGAYAMLAALAVQRPAWRRAMVKALDPARERALIAAMVRDGPAVDGVTLRREATIDGLAVEVHHEILQAILTITRDM